LRANTPYPRPSTGYKDITYDHQPQTYQYENWLLNVSGVHFLSFVLPPDTSSLHAATFWKRSVAAVTHTTAQTAHSTAGKAHLATWRTHLTAGRAY
jgi:hypothetical protein